MLKGFKEFFLRGNVVHLAVAVIVGTAFTTFVTAIANNWISPMFAAFGGRNPNGLAVTLVDGNLRSVVDFGAILTAVAVFAAIAALVYYLVVLPYKEIQLRRMLSTRASGPPTPTEVQLLADIRGLLSQQLHAGQIDPAAAASHNGQTNGAQRLAVEITPAFTARLVMLGENTPGLMIDYGGNQLAFAAGQGTRAVVSAHEFAVNLAYTALAFASRCRIQMAPRHSAPSAPTAPAASA
jgi:large conductance mechanosensitive channel